MYVRLVESWRELELGGFGAEPITQEPSLPPGRLSPAGKSNKLSPCHSPLLPAAHQSDEEDVGGYNEQTMITLSGLPMSE